MRLPHAARTLIDQVQERKRRAKAQPYGEPDGLQVVRTVRFDKATSKWLKPLLDVAGDERLQEVNVEDGQLLVTFVPTRQADSRRPFDLEAAEVVSAQREDSSPQQ